MGVDILPEIQRFQAELLWRFSKAWIHRLTETLSATQLKTTAMHSPQALNPAIGFTTINLHPFKPPVATPAVTVGQICISPLPLFPTQLTPADLIVFSFFSFTFYLPLHSSLIVADNTPHLRFSHWIAWRIAATTTTVYFFFSLSYSLTSLAFHIPSPCPRGLPPRPPPPPPTGPASFPVYWMLNFAGTMALGFPCENVGMIVGFHWFALWLIFWVITNIAVTFYAIPLAPQFYRCGYAWPVTHIVDGSRTIPFDTHSRLGLDFGVLAAWVGS